jgi:hypothetical protein
MSRHQRLKVTMNHPRRIARRKGYRPPGQRVQRDKTSLLPREALLALFTRKSDKDT